MKIWGHIPNVSKIYGNTNRIGRTSKVGETASKKDELTISGFANDFSIAMKALKNVPDIRQEKVDEISQKIEKGEYSVPPGEIAAKILGLKK
ncbi:MAG: flagellar biosynthesis anti-sigma factor FlgM [Clostridiaceae bacterium]|nr:flagellar biosynthesis anti-sigma factor FlgM [Clostridiaceae bacterium]